MSWNIIEHGKQSLKYRVKTFMRSEVFFKKEIAYTFCFNYAFLSFSNLILVHLSISTTPIKYISILLFIYIFVCARHLIQYDQSNQIRIMTTLTKNDAGYYITICSKNSFAVYLNHGILFQINCNGYTALTCITRCLL